MFGHLQQWTFGKKYFFCQSRFKILPMTRWTLNNCPRLYFLQKWQFFAKSGHTFFVMFLYSSQNAQSYIFYLNNAYNPFLSCFHMELFSRSSYKPNCQTSLVIVICELTLFFSFPKCNNLGPYEPSPFTKEIHNLTREHSL